MKSGGGGFFLSISQLAKIMEKGRHFLPFLDYIGRVKFKVLLFKGALSFCYVRCFSGPSLKSTA